MSVGCGWASEQDRGGLWDCGVWWEEPGYWTKREVGHGLLSDGEEASGEGERGKGEIQIKSSPLPLYPARRPNNRLCFDGYVSTRPPLWFNQQHSSHSTPSFSCLLTHDSQQKCQIELEMSEGKLIIMTAKEVFIGASCFSFVLQCSLQSAFLSLSHSSVEVTIPRALLSCLIIIKRCLTADNYVNICLC